MNIFTLDDITHLPDEFGGDVGWFYGLVKNHETNNIGIYEIFPGIGYGKIVYSWRIKIYLWMIRDIYRQITIKKKFARLSEEEFINRVNHKEKEIQEAKSWDRTKETFEEFIDNDEIWGTAV
jgi:hypothetical protein